MSTVLGAPVKYLHYQVTPLKCSVTELTKYHLCLLLFSGSNQKTGHLLERLMSQIRSEQRLTRAEVGELSRYIGLLILVQLRQTT